MCNENVGYTNILRIQTTNIYNIYVKSILFEYLISKRFVVIRNLKDIYLSIKSYLVHFIIQPTLSYDTSIGMGFPTVTFCEQKSDKICIPITVLECFALFMR